MPPRNSHSDTRQDFNPLEGASWIWLEHPNEPSRTNCTAAFCKRLELPEPLPATLTLAITADSRYRVFVNGAWVGDGPVRAYPKHYKYDLYSLRDFVRPGENVIEAYVCSFGVSTFHYVAEAPGLLAAVAAGAEALVATDATWEARPAREFAARTPRVSCQQDFEEQFDARQVSDDWRLVNVVRAQCDDVHRDLRPSDVQPLSRAPLHFKRAVEAQRIESLRDVWSLRMREALAPYPEDANIYPLAGLFVTEFTLEADADVEWIWTGPTIGLFIDGQPVAGDGDQGVVRAETRLKAGRRLLTLPVAGPAHGTDISIGWRCEQTLTWGSPEDNGETPWVCVGPLWRPERATNCFMKVPGRTESRQAEGGPHLPELPSEVGDAVRRLAGLSTYAELKAATDMPPRALTLADLSETDVYLAVRGDRVVASERPRVLDLDRCLTDNSVAAEILPDRGAGVRVLLDLDDLTIGWFEMRLTASEGTVVDGYFFEHRIEQPGADPIVQHTGMHHNTFRYVCREGLNHFVSRKRRGMRYAMLTFRNTDRAVRLHLARVIEGTYPVEHRGEFHCSDERLNRIYDISRRTLQVCMEDVFTDCPLYEQTLWIGDARNEAFFAFYAFAAYDIAKRCVRLGAESLETLPIVGCQVPSGWDVILPAWSFLWEIMVWETYLFSGDREFLEAIYPAAMQNVRHALTFCTDRGLFSVKAWNMFDWTGTDHNHNTVLHNSLFLVGALDAARRCADALGRADDARFCADARHKLVQAINALWDERKQAHPDSIHADGRVSDRVSQHASALALLYDVVPDERRVQALRNVLDPPEGMVRVGSPFAMFYFLEALEKEGRADAVMEQIRRYWGIMLDWDARTCWETVRLDSGAFPTRSHCHGWSAAPVAVLPRLVLGVAPAEPGFREAIVRPQALGLRFARGRVPTPFGPIRVEWERREDGTFGLHVDGPPQVKLHVDRSGLV